MTLPTAASSNSASIAASTAAPSNSASVAASKAALEVLAEMALEAFVGALRRRPELASHLRETLAIGKTQETSSGNAPVFLSVAQYAAYRCVSERTIRYDLKKMEEGVHYERAGGKGRRCVIRVVAADAWYVARAGSETTPENIDQLAVDEVTRRRARVALNKRKGK